MSPEPSIVAKRIQQIRKARKLSRSQLADKLGTTYLQIYRIEKGITALAANDAPRFASVLQVEVADLYKRRAS